MERNEESKSELNRGMKKEINTLSITSDVSLDQKPERRAVKDRNNIRIAHSNINYKSVLCHFCF